MPVTEGGILLNLAFAGGLVAPQHQFVDLDGDGDLDLLILDVDAPLHFYRNEGSASSPEYVLRPRVISFPPVAIWFVVVDYDGDGLPDLLTADASFSGVCVYRNAGTPTVPSFVSFIPRLTDVHGVAVFGGQNSIPALTDIDGDGDLDFFSPDVSGKINFYANVGTRQTPAYQFVTDAWQGILIVGDSCFSAGPAQRPVHGATALQFADIDADGDRDLFVGDYYATSTFFIRNVGTPSSPLMQCTDNAFPPPDPVRTPGYNQPDLVDLDGDGDLDLLVGVLSDGLQRHILWQYENVGLPATPDLRFTTTDFLKTIDVGKSAHPAFVDIDADGDADMFVGHLLGGVMFFRNDGSASSPSFVLADTAYQSIGGGYAFVPAFVDIDGDGDQDLFVGRFDGTIRFYRNTGSPQAAVFTPAPSPTDSISGGQWVAPAFVDIDGDGDQDLFVGRSGGAISFYRNMGSPASFVPVLVTSFFQSINTGLSCVPTFCDIDGDGDADLFVGTQENGVMFYENSGTNLSPQFDLVTSNVADADPMREASPAFFDIDGDGDQDLFVGTFMGGLHFYRNDGVVHVSENPEMPVAVHLEQNFPNPFNPVTNVEFRMRNAGMVSLKVFDVLGREVAVLLNGDAERGTHRLPFDASGLASGIYVCRLTAGGETSSVRMILLK